ncbi:SDR family oxidoreductase [candidate division WS5 bacterium]|uniref:SDR family oxidoreductase n=1 Tax=candidate division WS5 bacterium TaxID=2093353 RepID=A0A419DDT3_9BACT|nr:MAG: SDR family oxidoreductase [candidate division WS5 bacterium]
MKVLITGGAGFIGSHIVDGLVNEGYEVVIVDDLSTGNENNINKKAKFYNVDIKDKGLESVFEKERPDFVGHQAAQKDVRVSVSDPIYDAKINILGTINLLQNCIKYKVKKIVFASTGGAIYGEQDIFPAPEIHPTRPISPYGITKLVAEHYMYYYKTVHGLDYVSLRYANVYGPRQDPHGEAGVVAIFIQKMLAGEQPVINGDGEQTRDFVYVGDVARANILSIKNTTSENIFNIGTGIEISVNELFNQIRDIVNPNISKKNGPPKEGEQLRSVIDFSRARSILHWKPEVLLSEGLKKTFNHFNSFSNSGKQLK